MVPIVFVGPNVKWEKKQVEGGREFLSILLAHLSVQSQSGSPKWYMCKMFHVTKELGP